MGVRRPRLSQKRGEMSGSRCVALNQKEADSTEGCDKGLGERGGTTQEAMETGQKKSRRGEPGVPPRDRESQAGED